MAEYIDREALLEDLQAAVENGGMGGMVASALKRYVKRAPAADVAPVRHGQWIFGKDLPYSWGQIPKNKYHLYCSECLEQAFNRSEDNDPDFDVETPYCPACGCCVDGGAD